MRQPDARFLNVGMEGAWRLVPLSQYPPEILSVPRQTSAVPELCKRLDLLEAVKSARHTLDKALELRLSWKVVVVGPD